MQLATFEIMAEVAVSGVKGKSIQTSCIEALKQKIHMHHEFDCCTSCRVAGKLYLRSQCNEAPNLCLVLKDLNNQKSFSTFFLANVIFNALVPRRTKIWIHQRFQLTY